MNLSSLIGVFQLLTAFIWVPFQLYYIYNFSWWGDIGFPAFVLAILVGAVLMFGFSLIGNLFFTSEDGTVADQQKCLKTLFELTIFCNILMLIVTQSAIPDLQRVLVNPGVWGIPIYILMYKVRANPLL